MKNINFLQRGKDVVMAMQHLIACFGATTLVPILLGLEIPVALFSAGVGTLIFHLVTKGKVPVFLGSSFAFIPVIGAVLASTNSIPHAQGGIMLAGMIYLVMGLLVQKYGISQVQKILKPHVMGTMIVIIGLSLIPVAFGMSMDSFPLALQTLAFIMILMIFFNGFVSKMAIILGIGAGYIVGALSGIVDYSPIVEASWIQIPAFSTPVFHLPSMLAIAPVVIAVFMEHLGDISASQTIVGKNFIKNPGIGRTLMGDGLATLFAGLVGGPPNTTYSENTGILAATKNYNPAILRMTAVFAIALAFLGKLGAVLQTIPVAVIGGASLILFGMIAKIGAITLWEDKFFKSPRRLATVIVMLFLGLNPYLTYEFFGVEFAGVALAAIAGLLLTVIFNCWEKWTR